MKDKWDKFKIFTDSLKNIPFIIAAITAVLSASGNIMQYFESDEILKEKDEQIAAIANYYNPEKEVSVKVIEQPDGTWKAEITEKLNKIDGKLTKTLKDFHGVK